MHHHNSQEETLRLESMPRSEMSSDRLLKSSLEILIRDSNDNYDKKMTRGNVNARRTVSVDMHKEDDL